MRRYLFNSLNVGSIILFGLTAIAWARSRSRVDIFFPGLSPSTHVLVAGAEGKTILGLCEPNSVTGQSLFLTHAAEGSEVSAILYLYITDDGLSVDASFAGFEYHSGSFGSGFVLPDWSILLASLLSPTIWLAKSYRTHQLAAANRCVRCGYDLRATPERCPECGTATKAEVRR